MAAGRQARPGAARRQRTHPHRLPATLPPAHVCRDRNLHGRDGAGDERARRTDHLHRGRAGAPRAGRRAFCRPAAHSIAEGRQHDTPPGCTRHTRRPGALLARRPLHGRGKRTRHRGHASHGGNGRTPGASHARPRGPDRRREALRRDRRLSTAARAHRVGEDRAAGHQRHHRRRHHPLRLRRRERTDSTGNQTTEGKVGARGSRAGRNEIRGVQESRGGRGR